MSLLLTESLSSQMLLRILENNTALHQISGKLAPAIHFVKFLPPLPFSIEVTLKYWKPVVVAALKFKRKPNWKEFVKRK